MAIMVVVFAEDLGKDEGVRLLHRRRHWMLFGLAPGRGQFVAGHLHNDFGVPRR